MDDHHSELVAKAILLLANAVNESTSQRQNELDLLRLFSSLETKHDLKELGELIMSLVKDLGAQLATVDDALDKILTEIQALEASIASNGTVLPPDAQANLDRLTAVVTAIQNVLTPTATAVTLDAIANQTAPVGGASQTVALTGIATTTKGATLTATVVSSDTTIVPTVTVVLDAAPATTGTVSFTPGVAGVATLTVTISDGTAQAVKLFTVTVA